MLALSALAFGGHIVISAREVPAKLQANESDAQRGLGAAPGDNNAFRVSAFEAVTRRTRNLAMEGKRRIAGSNPESSFSFRSVMRFPGRRAW